MNSLTKKRAALGKTLKDISASLKAVEPRIDVGMVSRYEHGVCLPTREQLEALEAALQASRFDLYDIDDLDLLKIDEKACEEQGDGDADKPWSKETRFRKCYRIPRIFAENLPPDLLAVCGYSSWQSWHDASLKRLLGEYAARKKAKAK